jgi:hypothetical protein
MTNTVFAVIDNHNKKKGTTYNIIYKTKNIKDFMDYLKEKGLVT